MVAVFPLLSRHMGSSSSLVTLRGQVPLSRHSLSRHSLSRHSLSRHSLSKHSLSRHSKQTPFGPPSDHHCVFVTWRYLCFRGFQYTSGRYGNVYPGCWAQRGCIFRLPCCHTMLAQPAIMLIQWYLEIYSTRGVSVNSPTQAMDSILGMGLGHHMTVCLYCTH